MQGAGELGRVDTAEAELAIRVGECCRWLEGDTDFVSGDEALAERVVGDGRDAFVHSGDKGP